MRAIVLPRGPARTVATLEPQSQNTLQRALHEAARGERARIPAPRAATEVPAIEIAVTPPLGDRGVATLVARDGPHVVPIAGLAMSVDPPVLGPVWPAPDGRHVVVAIDLPGFRSLEVVDLRRTRAALETQAGLEAFVAGDRHGAARRWQRAVEIDPRFGDAIYNLACLHATGGELALAKQELELALAIDPRRYRRLARTDPDLALLRRDPEIRRWIGARDAP